MYWAMSWGKDSPAAEGSLPLVSRAGGLDGSYSLEAHLDHKIHHPVVGAKFIVILGNELNKEVTEDYASPSIKDDRVGVTVNVAGQT